MSFNYALLAELTERKRKLQLKEIKNYDDAVVTRNSKFVTAKVLNPLPIVNSSKFRSVGSRDQHYSRATDMPLPPRGVT